ncbi:MAG: protein kinase [Ottowia sp.]|nr:protein kinase [Ottowia sp.]
MLNINNRHAYINSYSQQALDKTHQLNKESTIKLNGDHIPFESLKFHLFDTEKIAHGGQGNIYILSDENGKKYAGKVFNQEHYLLKEQSAYKKIGSHPNIVNYHGTTSINGKTYLVTELVNGDTLKNFIHKCDDFCKSHPKDINHIAEIKLIFAKQLISALNHLEEKGLSHADIKPENILVANDGKIKLIDFGMLTKATNQISNTLGTANYLAPELIVIKGDSSKIDSFATANVLLELVTGFKLHQSYAKFERNHHHQNDKLLKKGTHAKSSLNPMLAAGMHFTLRRKLPSMDQLSASGEFFPSNLNKEIANKQKIHEELRNNIIKPLQLLESKNRASIKEISLAVETMASNYINKKTEEEALSLFNKISNKKLPSESKLALFHYPSLNPSFDTKRPLAPIAASPRPVFNEILFKPQPPASPSMSTASSLNARSSLDINSSTSSGIASDNQSNITSNKSLTGQSSSSDISSDRFSHLSSESVSDLTSTTQAHPHSKYALVAKTDASSNPTEYELIDKEYLTSSHTKFDLAPPPYRTRISS